MSVRRPARAGGSATMAASAGSLALPLPAAGVGDPLPTPELEKFKQTEAESFEDLFGRVVIIEFFEYW